MDFPDLAWPLQFTRSSKKNQKLGKQKEKNMASNISHKLKSDIHLACCSCKQKDASHAYRFEYAGVCFQLCICADCISMGEQQLSSRFMAAL
jgi:hypothetical protein